MRIFLGQKVLNPPRKKSFRTFLKDLAKSAPKLKVVVTTWEEVAFVDINVKHMSLNLLSGEESLELLKSRDKKTFKNKKIERQ